jgi:hypothetical protein
MNSTVYDWADLQNIRQPLICGKIGYIPLQILFEELFFGGVAMPVTRVESRPENWERSPVKMLARLRFSI